LPGPAKAGQAGSEEERLMERILVGVDGSPHSLHALRWAAGLAEHAGLELVAGRVYAPTETQLAEALGEGPGLREEHLAELRQWCESLAGGCPTRDCVLLDGDPPEALIDGAKQRGADMLVVGARGAGGFAHLLIGSVAHQLTRHTTLPLAVVPPSAGLAIDRLVVGNEGSQGGAAAVGLTAELAPLLEVPVTAVYAYDTKAESQPFQDPAQWHALAEERVRGWAAPITQTGSALDVYIDRDPNCHPVPALEHALERRPGSVAVLGTRGRGGFLGLRLGRVPIQLIDSTSHAIILVPAATT
jgi:nucleotide-binding universal stress UspA family protein